MKRRIAIHVYSPGTSLIELMASMAIFSLILAMLATALQGALGSFRTGVDRSENVMGNQAALQWIKEDLESAISARNANLPRLPDSVSPRQRQFFENKIFFPIEINRRQGNDGQQSTFTNSYPGFDTIAFVSGNAATSASLTGYYVAYTKNSPLPGSGDRASMKLHRHYRSSGGILAAGYADGFLLHLSNRINDAIDESSPGGVRPLKTANPAALRMGNFSNRDLPFLFSHLVKDPGKLQPIPAVQPWPVNPIPALLNSPPPNLNPGHGTEAEWSDRDSKIHDTVFPDEPLVRNVVRFEIRPYRRVKLNDGTIQIMDAVALNQYLGLSGGDEWPCLVRPDFIEITLGLIRENATSPLSSAADWIVDWSKTDPAQWSDTRKLIEQNLHTFHLRITLRRGG